MRAILLSCTLGALLFSCSDDGGTGGGRDLRRHGRGQGPWRLPAV